MAEKYVTCRCQYCDKGIEFDSGQLDPTGNAGNFTTGQTIACPHCGMNTILYAPKSFPKHVEKIKAGKSKTKNPASRFSPVLVCCIGIGLLFTGASTDATAQSIMQQIYGAIEFCSGWIIVSMAVLINVLVTISKNQSDE